MTMHGWSYRLLIMSASVITGVSSSADAKAQGTAHAGPGTPAASSKQASQASQASPALLASLHHPSKASTAGDVIAISSSGCPNSGCARGSRAAADQRHATARAGCFTTTGTYLHCIVLIYYSSNHHHHHHHARRPYVLDQGVAWHKASQRAALVVRAHWRPASAATISSTMLRCSILAGTLWRRSAPWPEARGHSSVASRRPCWTWRYKRCQRWRCSRIASRARP